ncbi:MAG: hypothetical protein ABIJ47_01390 [Candidatus Bathyarchaeota archaeon]
MNRQTQTTLAWGLIILAFVLGGAYFWGTSTIVADTTPPVIDEAATTSGAIAYGTGKPTVVLFVTENLGMQQATAEIFNVGLLGIRGSLVQKCTMGQASKTGNVYKYVGAFTVTLEANKEYYILYTATDTAGHKDTYEPKIKLVNLEGQVHVNSVKVKGPGDTIYVTSLKLEFKVVVTQGAGSVDKIYCVVGADTINFAKSYDGYGIEQYTGTYTLPGDGKYEFVVIVKDTGSTNTQLASFGIVLGTEQRWPLIIGTLGVLGVAAVYFSVEQPKKTKKLKTGV